MKKIHEILTENITKDYYTPNIKAEVILDMILTPVIGEILTAVGKRNKNLNIKGDMRMIAKEFPLLRSDQCNYRNCDVDYLMCDEESVYFVELKTAQESLDLNQMMKYRKYLADSENQKFSDVFGAAFIDLLNHVSKTGISFNCEDKPWRKTGKNDLKRLFEAVIQYPKYRRCGKDGGEIPLEENWEKEKAHHVDDAIAYLKKTKAVSSKKYLLTAGQMLDQMKDGRWWDCKQIKLLYLMPQMPVKEKIKEKILENNIIVVTFQEIMKQAHVICREDQNLNNYWKWVMEVLIQCGLY